MQKGIYAVAFVMAVGLGIAFGTSPYAAEAAHGSMTDLSGLRGCNQTGKTAPWCEVKAAAIKPATQEHAINSKGTGAVARATAPGATADGPSKTANGTKVRTKSNQANE